MIADDYDDGVYDYDHDNYDYDYDEQGDGVDDTHP